MTIRMAKLAEEVAAYWVRHCPQCGNRLEKGNPPDYDVMCKCGWIWKGKS